MGWEAAWDLIWGAARGGVSLIVMSDQDAVLDLPPFEKVGRKL